MGAVLDMKIITPSWNPRESGMKSRNHTGLKYPGYMDVIIPVSLYGFLRELQVGPVFFN
jgi:hypothetical protein